MTPTKQREHHQGTEARRRPQRTCIACRETRAKHELVRIVRDVSGAVVVDGTGKLSGRGAYLCADEKCWERGIRGNYLEHRLLIGAPLSEKDRHRIRDEVQTVIRSRLER